MSNTFDGKIANGYELLRMCRKALGRLKRVAFTGKYDHLEGKPNLDEKLSIDDISDKVFVDVGLPYVELRNIDNPDFQSSNSPTVYPHMKLRYNRSNMITVENFSNNRDFKVNKTGSYLIQGTIEIWNCSTGTYEVIFGHTSQNVSLIDDSVSRIKIQQQGPVSGNKIIIPINEVVFLTKDVPIYLSITNSPGLRGNIFKASITMLYLNDRKDILAQKVSFNKNYSRYNSTVSNMPDDITFDESSNILIGDFYTLPLEVPRTTLNPPEGEQYREFFGWYYQGGLPGADMPLFQPGDKVPIHSEGIVFLCNWGWYLATSINDGSTDLIYQGYYPSNTTGVIAPENPYTRPGYSFVNWNTASDGSGVSYSPGDIVQNDYGNIKLYAQWEEEDPYSNIEVSYQFSGSTPLTTTTLYSAYETQMGETFSMSPIFNQYNLSYLAGTDYNEFNRLSDTLNLAYAGLGSDVFQNLEFLMSYAPSLSDTPQNFTSHCYHNFDGHNSIAFGFYPDDSTIDPHFSLIIGYALDEESNYGHQVLLKSDNSNTPFTTIPAIGNTSYIGIRLPKELVPYWEEASTLA